MSLHKTGTLVMDEDSNSKPLASWGKLVPLTQGLVTVEISTDSFLIGRNP
jgi:hypothetical protein